MSALDDFFSKQRMLGRAALVAACVAAFSPVAAAEAHYDISKLGGVQTVIFDGEAQHYLSGPDGRKTLDFIIDHLNKDMDAVEKFTSGLPNNIGPNLAKPELSGIKSSLKATIAKLGVNNQLREEFTNLAIAPDMADQDQVIFLSQRANQRTVYVEQMEMKLKELQGAVLRNDKAAIVDGLKTIKVDVEQQDYVEDGLRSLGKETGRL